MDNVGCDRELSVLFDKNSDAFNRLSELQRARTRACMHIKIRLFVKNEDTDHTFTVSLKCAQWMKRGEHGMIVKHRGNFVKKIRLQRGR